MLADEKAREEIRAERKQNVVIDAGAGTGKTAIIVDRFLNLLAPADSRNPAPIHRLAAVTFTRRAAGELRYRILEKILAELESGKLKPDDRALLQDALSGIDNAFIGTIHSFADRLLKLRPTEAELSPAYGIEENTGELVSITFEILCRAAKERNMTEAASMNSGLAKELENTLNDYILAGYALETSGGSFAKTHGLDSLVESMIESRDVQPDFKSPSAPDFSEIRKMARVAAKSIRILDPTSPGFRLLQGLSFDLDRVVAAKDGISILRAVRLLGESGFETLQKERDFLNDEAGWELKKSLKESSIPGISTPVMQWMCARLARLGPAVCAIYERVKREHEVVDQLDLLLKLRDVLRKEEHRVFYSGMFDHIFVDEFQDTDPVQADIVRLLVSVKAGGKPRPGSVTIVGDAKQSIYRFRRADISAYEKFREWLEKNGALTRSLTTNFRSVAPLVNFVNERFEKIMGKVENGKIFDPENGAVFYEALTESAAGNGPAVHLIPIAGNGDDKLKVDAWRSIEAESLARYVLHLKTSGFRVRDQETDSTRPMRWRDVAVLSLTTTSWNRIFAEFDRFGIPYAARGGSVFARDPAVRAIILALRAIADSADGPALAQYFRPPFWILSMDDVAGESKAFQQAQEVLSDLRFRRLQRPAFETARDLLDRTRCVATVLGSPNGAQTLAKIQELLNILDMRSRSGLDFDAVTLDLREWIDGPPQMDAPEPVSDDIVRFTTVYQAKGLEYPVVILADVFQEKTHSDSKSWMASVAKGTPEAVIRLTEVKGEVPAGAALRERDKSFGDAEMIRKAYVAVTRARDLLVLCRPASASDKFLYKPLMSECAKTVQTIGAFTPGRIPSWAGSSKEQPLFRPAPAISADPCEKKWKKSLVTAIRPEAAPRAITATARMEIETEEDSSEKFRRDKSEGRFGAVFGLTVHRALQMLANGAAGTGQEIVSRCAAECQLTTHLAEAVADVERAWSAVSKIHGDKFSEYPVSAIRPDGYLDIGYIDLLCIGEKEIWVIDYKTDVPPKGRDPSPSPVYMKQLQSYASILTDTKIFRPRPIRSGLLYTATGVLVEINAAKDSVR